MNLLIPVVMIIFGWIFRKNPPSEINNVYGYRTARSMASQETWQYAQKYMGKIWFWVGIIMLPFSVAAMLPCMGKSDTTIGIWGSVICIVECVFLVLSIIPIEKALKKRFG